MGVASTNNYYWYVSCEVSTDEGDFSKVKINVCLSIHSTFIIKLAIMIEKQVSPFYIAS